MDKITEELMKERLPIHPKCRGEGFSDADMKFITSARCNRIDPIDIENGEKSFTDPASCLHQFEGLTYAVQRHAGSYVNPSNWWRHDWRCPLGEHFRPDLAMKDSKKARVGQQKQKKKK